MVHHFLQTNPYKMSIFQRSVTCSFFFRNCTHILTRTQAKMFEDTFLVKIASKGTSLNQFKPIQTNSFSFDNSMSRIFYFTLLTEFISMHDDTHQNQGSRKLDNLFCGKGSSVNYTNLSLLEYMLQSHESSWRFPSTLQTILNLSLINLKRSSVEQLKT